MEISPAAAIEQARRQLEDIVFVTVLPQDRAADHDAARADSGTIRLLVAQGTAHVTAKGAFDITLSGTLVHWDTSDEADAFVTVHFESAAPSE